MPDIEFDYIDISSIDNARNVITSPKRLLGQNAPSRARQVVRSGDVLLSTVRTYLKNVAMVPPELDGATASTGFCVLRPAPHIEGRYLLHRVLEDRWVQRLSERQTGTSYPAVRDVDVRAMLIELPPLTEQRRIVEAIEAQLSRLNSGEESLRAGGRRISGFEQAALARLISWDHESRSIEEVASGRRHSLAIGPFGSNLKVSDYRDEGVPLVFVRNIRARDFDGLGLKYVSHEKAASLAAHVVRKGDVLVTKMGDPPGDVAVYSKDEPAVMTADCIKITPADDVAAGYLALAIASPRVKGMVQEITSGVAQKKTSLARFRKHVRVPVPPLEEQLALVQLAEQLFSLSQSLRAQLDGLRARARTLRDALLREAFAGRLVPHDLTDQPPIRLSLESG